VFDLKWLRDHPAEFDAALGRRGQPPSSASILALDTERRRLETALQENQAERNQLSREIGLARSKGLDTSSQQARVGELKDGLKAAEEALRGVGGELEELLRGFPNILQPDVPDGADERANVEIRRVGAQRNFAFEPKLHDELGPRLGLDLERAARMSGARFAVLWGALARLERALAQLMLDIQTQEHGYTEVAVPYLVRDEALRGTGQLPKFADDLFKTTAGSWLIPTAEVPLTNLVHGEILEEARLPLRVTACTPCFRSEAGAAGKDTRGMIRQHQFSKVELVSITTPEQSADEHERMTRAAEAVLQRLELPYRVMLLAAGDTGFASTKTYDIEVWLPGQGAYREISSCSNCGDFQARRMNARYRTAERRTRFVHTLNGSGLAIGRALIAVMENYQEADGSVTIPAALRPWMGGMERLAPHD
jgi:seryl-tRNA synthetase